MEKHGDIMKNKSLLVWAKENNPRLITEWDNTQNLFSMESVTTGSDKKAWWICSKGHSWSAVISSRVAGGNCPFCSNQKVLPGYNDLATVNGELSDEWDYLRNGTLLPTEVTGGSNKKVWWICQKGHSWEASISSRSRGTGCPYCCNQRTLTGYNDLATLNPILAKEWNYEKNGNLKPTDITAKSNRRVWWKCKNGHEWENSPNQRNNRGCPYCSNQLLLPGYNDLFTTHPEALNEWDYTKNLEINPRKVQAGSEKKVWWICARGHSYLMQIDLKVKYGYSCPKCSKGRHVSFAEKAVAYYFIKVDSSVIEGFHDDELHISEIDVYIPNRKIGIEYDGKRWHNNTVERDLRKNLRCNDNGITLYRIRENGCVPIENSTSIDYYYNPQDVVALGKIIKELISTLYGLDITVDIEKDKIQIYKLIDGWFDNHSGGLLDDNILAEWNYEKNQGLSPENFSLNTHKKVWWVCSVCGGEWQASLANRNNNRGCPYCTGHKLLTGFNDLATVAPDLLTEWDYKRNIELPSSITAHSAKKVWWTCSQGHSYQAKISNRVDLERECPVCKNRMVIRGVNDLATTNQELVEEWDYLRNKIRPYEITAGSPKKVWWICSKCGFSWSTSPNARTYRKTGCPKCADAAKGAATKRSVQQLTVEGGIIASFSSVKEAADSVNRTPSAIVNACKGKVQTCAGFRWQYIVLEK